MHVINPMPLTSVGKIFKPALRWDAAQRVALGLLADLPLDGGRSSVEAGAHPLHGSLLTVTIESVPETAREALARQVQERLGPLTMKHEIVWR
jgi:fatty-acyl-CoA synthase